MSSEALPETTREPSIILNVGSMAEHRKDIEELLATIKEKEPDTSAETLDRLETAIKSANECRRRMKELSGKDIRRWDRVDRFFYSCRLNECKGLARAELDTDSNTYFKLSSRYPDYNRIILPGFSQSQVVTCSKDQGWFMQNRKETLDGKQSLEVSAPHGQSPLHLGSVVDQNEEQARMIHGNDPANVEIMTGKPNIWGKYTWGAWDGLRSPSLRVKSLAGMAPIDMVEEQVRALNRELKTFEKAIRWHLKEYSVK